MRAFDQVLINAELLVEDSHSGLETPHDAIRLHGVQALGVDAFDGEHGGQVPALSQERLIVHGGVDGDQGVHRARLGMVFQDAMALNHVRSPVEASPRCVCRRRNVTWTAMR